MRLIKRYKNRRLYDIENSRTITQMELALMVKQGHDIVVIDNATGVDITLEVLGRTMISETDNWEDKKDSKELLKKLILIGGDKSMSVLKNTVLASIGAFNVTKAKAEKIIDDLIKKGELDKSDRKKAVMELLEKAEKSTAQIRDKISRGADKTQQEITKVISNINVAKATDLKKLEAKVDKMTKALKAIEKKLNELG